MPWDNKNNGPWDGGNNPWGKKDSNNSNNNWNPKNKGDDLFALEEYNRAYFLSPQNLATKRNTSNKLYNI